MIRQQNNERLRRQFASKANIVGQWIERHLDAVASIGMQKGKLEEHLNKLRGIEREVNAFRPNMDELEKYNEEVQEAMIFENKHTPYSMEVSYIGWIVVCVCVCVCVCVHLYASTYTVLQYILILLYSITNVTFYHFSL